MIKIRHLVGVVLVLGLSLLLSGCDWAMLDPKGMIAAREKYILLLSVYLMLIVIVPVMIMAVWFSWRYRDGNHKATYSPDAAHNNWIEAVVWAIPCIIIAILGTITWVTSHTLDPYRPLDINAKPVTIQAIALDWKWLFIYPEQHIAAINFIEVPTGVPIRFLITSEGPMNSLSIPQLGSQIYAMAGMQTKLHLVADAPGDYKGFSANLSGEGFSDMKFTVRATTQNDFDQWVKTVKKGSTKLTMAEYVNLVKPTTGDPVKYYSSVNDKIFDTVVMKSMMPMPMNDKA